MDSVAYPPWAPWQTFVQHAGKDYTLLGHAIFAADGGLAEREDDASDDTLQYVWLSDVMLPRILTVYPVAALADGPCDTLGNIDMSFPTFQSSLSQRKQTLRVGLVIDTTVNAVVYGALLVNRRVIQAAWRDNCIVPCVADMLALLGMFHKHAAAGLSMCGPRIQEPPTVEVDGTGAAAEPVLARWVQSRIEFPVTFGSPRRSHTVHIPGTTVSLDVENITVVSDEEGRGDHTNAPCTGGVVLGYGAAPFTVALRASRQMADEEGDDDDVDVAPAPVPVPSPAPAQWTPRSRATLVVVPASSVASRMQQLTSAYPTAVVLSMFAAKDFNKHTWRAVQDADYVVTTSSFLQSKLYLAHMARVLNNVVSAPHTTRRLLLGEQAGAPPAVPRPPTTKSLKRKRDATGGGGGSDVPRTRGVVTRARVASSAVPTEAATEEASVEQFFDLGKSATRSGSTAKYADAPINVVPYWVTCARRVLADCPACGDLTRPVLELLQFRAIVQSDVDRQSQLNVKRMRVFAQASWLVVSSIGQTFTATMAKWDLALPRSVSDIPNVYAKFEMLYNNMLLHVKARTPTFRVVAHAVPVSAREDIRHQTYRLAGQAVPSGFKYSTTSMATPAGEGGRGANRAGGQGVNVRFATQGNEVTTAVTEMSRLQVLDLVVRREQMQDRLREFGSTRVAMDTVTAGEGDEDPRSTRRMGTIEEIAREHIQRTGTNIQTMTEELAQHASMFITNALHGGARMVAVNNNNAPAESAPPSASEPDGSSQPAELNDLTYEYFEDEDEDEDEDGDGDEYEEFDEFDDIDDEDSDEDDDDDSDDSDDDDDNNADLDSDFLRDDDDLHNIDGVLDLFDVNTTTTNNGGPTNVNTHVVEINVDSVVGEDGVAVVPLLNEQAVLMFSMSVSMMESDIKKLDDIITNKQKDAKALVVRVADQVTNALNKTTCTICCSDIIDTMLPCGHTMCHTCAFEWVPFKARCPLCTASHAKQLVVLLSHTTPAYPATMNPGWAPLWPAAHTDNTMSTFVFWLRSVIGAVEASGRVALILAKTPAEAKLLATALADATATNVRTYGGPYASRRTTLNMFAKGKAHVIVAMGLLLEGTCFSEVTHVVFPRCADKQKWAAYLRACMQCVAPRAGGGLGPIVVDTFRAVRPEVE